MAEGGGGGGRLGLRFHYSPPLFHAIRTLLTEAAARPGVEEEQEEEQEEEEEEEEDEAGTPVGGGRRRKYPDCNNKFAGWHLSSGASLRSAVHAHTCTCTRYFWLTAAAFR